jgi:hypothetical protein
MNDIFYLFPFLFVGMFFLVLFILHKKGWSDLEKEYRYEEMFQGERIGLISAAINGVNYNNSLVLKYNNDGFYLRPILVFRLFHKPLFIPWKEIKDIRDKKVLFVQLKELVIGSPTIAIMQLPIRVFSKIERMTVTKSILR